MRKLLQPENILKFLLMLCTIALSFKALREPDFWWML